MVLHSCDTNILVYYLNADCPEHAAARVYLNAQLEREDFAICELVLVELYVLLRNPAVFPSPLDPAGALSVVQRFRSNPHWKRVDYPGDLMDEIWQMAARPGISRRAVFDIRLALTLRHHGVTHFATRNTRHFEGLGLGLSNPIDE